MRSTEEMNLKAKTRTKLTCKNRHNHTSLARTQHTLVPHTYHEKGGSIFLQVLYYLESRCFDRENLNISDLATVYESSQFL